MSFTGHQLKGLEGLADAAKSIMKDEPIEEKKLDPVGKADADIDNDGDVDSSDEYLKKRRAAISKAIAKDKEEEEKEEEEVDEAIKADQAPYHPHKDDGEVADVEPSNQLDKDKDDIEVKDGEEEEAESKEVSEAKIKENRAMDAKLLKLVGKNVVVTTPNDQLENELVKDGKFYYVDGYDFETFASRDVKSIAGKKIRLKKDFYFDVMPEQTIKEGKFKEIEGMIGAGMTAKEILKDLKLKPEKQLIQFLKKMGAK